MLSALVSLLAHPARSALTILGIVIGVGSVIAVVAVSAGARVEVEARLQSIGTNLLLVQADADVALEGRHAIVTVDDARAIAREVPHLIAVAPSVFHRERAIHGNANRETTVQGVTNDYLVAREWEVDTGRRFTDDETDRGAKVALLGVTVKTQLFGATTPLDRVIRVGGVAYTVIGTMAPKGLSGAGSDQDDKVLVPLQTALNLLDGSREARRGRVHYIMVKVDGDDGLQNASQEIRSLLAQRRQRSTFEDTNLEVRNLSEALEARREASAVFGRSLIAVAMISLIVGGVSVMNIMLVAVSERTHEIGLRVAMGARRRDIRNQFLLETLCLAGLAGIFGTLLGVGASHIIAIVAGWPVLVRPEAILAGLVCATTTGLVFGIYPATRAARLNPIEALRSG